MKKLSVKRRFCILLAVMLALGLVSVLMIAAEAEQPGIGRHDIIILVDNSRGMLTFDKQDKRTGFVTFLERYLQAFSTENTSLGVARFAAETIELVPLTPVNDWTQSDIQEVRKNIKGSICPANQPPSDIQNPTPKDDPCYGTHYVDILKWAGEQLATCIESDPSNHCDIVIFTDGKMAKVGSDTRDDRFVDLPAVVQRALIDLDTRINLHIVRFGSDANQAEWSTWYDEGLFESYITEADSVPANEIYNNLLSDLGFSPLPSVEIPNNVPAALASDLPANTSLLTLSLLPDHNLDKETYSIPPTQETGYLRVWIFPPMQTLTATFAGTGTVFYQVVTQTLPLKASLNTWPDPPIVGSPFEMQAYLSAGEHPLTDTTRISFTVAPNADEPIALHPDAGGSWKTESPMVINDAGTHTFTMTARINGNSEPQVFLAEVEVADATHTAVVRSAPASAIAGDPITVDAVFYINDSLVDLPADSEVVVNFSPDDRSTQMQREDGFHWTATVKIAGSGVYTPQLVVNNVDWSGFDLVSSPVTIQEKPSILLTVDKQTARPGDSVEVTVSVQPDTSTPPEVSVKVGNQPPTPLKVEKLEEGIYQSRFIMPESDSVVIFAKQVVRHSNPVTDFVSLGSEALKLTSVFKRYWYLPIIVISLFIVVFVMKMFRRSKIVSENRLYHKNLLAGDEKSFSELEHRSIDKNRETVRFLGENVRDYVTRESKTSASFLQSLLEHAKKEGGIALAGLIYGLIDVHCSKEPLNTIFDLIYGEIDGQQFCDYIFLYPHVLTRAIDLYQKMHDRKKQGTCEQVINIWKGFAILNKEANRNVTSSSISTFLTMLESEQSKIYFPIKNQLDALKQTYQQFLHLSNNKDAGKKILEECATLNFGEGISSPSFVRVQNLLNAIYDLDPEKLSFDQDIPEYEAGKDTSLQEHINGLPKLESNILRKLLEQYGIA